MGGQSITHRGSVFLCLTALDLLCTTVLILVNLANELTGRSLGQKVGVRGGEHGSSDLQNFGPSLRLQSGVKAEAWENYFLVSSLLDCRCE